MGDSRKPDRETVFVITQARVGSTRLPGKVLKELTPGRTVLHHFLDRCLLAREADGVVVATTTEPEADRIVEVSEEFRSRGVRAHRGSIEDVLGRYYHAALEVGAGIVVRITSDCPLLDPKLVDAMITRFRTAGRTGARLDYLTNNMPRSFPHGLDVEVFTFAALSSAFEEAAEPPEREHVTPFLRNHPERFVIDNVAQQVDQSSMRWTLDYPEDLEFLREVYGALYRENPAFDREDVVRFLERHPEVASLNEMRREW